MIPAANKHLQVLWEPQTHTDVAENNSGCHLLSQEQGEKEENVRKNHMEVEEHLLRLFNQSKIG